MEQVRLITIGFSHYCEKARWALDRAGISFHEERHPPALHYRALRGLGVGGQVPVMVHEGVALADSTAILKWTDERNHSKLKLYPTDLDERRAVELLEDRFDEVLGPHIRRLVYFYGLQKKAMLIWTATQGVGRLDKVLLRLMMPFAESVFDKKLGLSVEQVEASRARVEAVFTEVDGLLSDGRRFLVGDTFSAADLTFAALAVPAFLPTNYGAPLPSQAQLAPGYQAWMQGVSNHASVAFARRLYREER